MNDYPKTAGHRVGNPETSDPVRTDLSAVTGALTHNLIMIESRVESALTRIVGEVPLAFAKEKDQPSAIRARMDESLERSLRVLSLLENLLSELGA